MGRDLRRGRDRDQDSKVRGWGKESNCSNPWWWGVKGKCSLPSLTGGQRREGEPSPCLGSGQLQGCSHPTRLILISVLVIGLLGGPVRWLRLLGCPAGHTGSYLPELSPGAPQPAFLAHGLKWLYETRWIWMQGWLDSNAEREPGWWYLRSLLLCRRWTSPRCSSLPARPSRGEWGLSLDPSQLAPLSVFAIPLCQGHKLTIHTPWWTLAF